NLVGLLLLIAVALLTFHGGWAQSRDAEPVVNMQSHKDFESRHLGNKRDIRVYLPPGYAAEKDKPYPVVSLQDGQARLKAEETADRLIRADRIRPLILVLVASSKDRFNEYAFHPWTTLKTGGRGALYGKFLTEEVKPFIDKEYRTLPDRE